MGYRQSILKAQVIALSLVTVLAFQNCAEPAPNTQPQSQTQQSVQDLELYIIQDQIAPGATLDLLASGGKPPYHFAVISGPGTMNGHVLQAGSSAGSIVISVVDFAGETKFGSVQVVIPQPPVAVTCALPWGGSIAQGQTVTAWAQSASPSCQSETRTCLSNGGLSGSFSHRNCSSNEGVARGRMNSNCGAWNYGYAVTGNQMGSVAVSSSVECVSYCQALGDATACHYVKMSNGGGSCKVYRGTVSLYRTVNSQIATTCVPGAAWSN